MARNSLPSPLESALANAPTSGLPDSFKQEGQQQPSFTPGNVPFQSYFNDASRKYGVPVNVLMALAQQESSFNPIALGQPTKYGRAKGLMQYIPSTAEGMGINPYDPVQSIDAAAKQLKTRMDKGYSMQEAVSAHFGGDDRRQWGPKTRAYGVEVLDKAQRFFDGTPGNVAQQQGAQEGVAEYPAAQGAAATSTDLDALREQGAKIDSLLGQLNKDEPDRYRALTQEEMAQYQQAQQQGTKPAQQQQLTAETPDMPVLDYSDANATQAEAKGIADKTLEAVKDAGTLLASGVNMAAKDVQELVGKIPYVGKPIVNAADRFDRWANGKGSEEIFKAWDKDTEKSLSPEMLQARKKAWVIEPGDDRGDGTKATSYSFGPAWSDPRSYASGIIESLPEMAITMGGSGRLASAAYKRALAGGATRAAAANTAARTATVAGGLLEGGLGGAQASRETREQILKLTPEQLKDSEALASIMDGGKSFEEARQELADNAASKAFALAGVTTGMFGGMGDRALAKIITGNSGRLKSALAGALGEGLFEEVPQSVGQQVSQNYAMQDADPNTSLMKGVANQAAGGLAVGGLMGAGMGAAAPRTGQDSQPADQGGQPAAEVPPAQPQVDPQLAQAEEGVAAVPTASRDDSGMSENAGPLERSLIGTAQQPDATNGNFWAGEPGATIQMQAKGDPQSALVATVERYERDGGVTVRGEDGTPYTVSPDEVDITAAAAPQVATDQQMQDAGTTEEVKAERAAVEQQQAQERQGAIEQSLQEQGIDPKTGEIRDDAPAEVAVREEASPAKKALDQMDEGELRDRMRYLATQAKTNGGWDKRLSDARREVEKVLDAKVKAAANTDAPAASAATEPAAQETGSPALAGADGKPKWFSSAEKAAAHLDKKGLTGYAVQEIRPGRYELHGINAEGPAVESSATGTTTQHDATAKPAEVPKSSDKTTKKTPNNPRINRVKKLVGDVGETVSPSGDVGYMSAGGRYRIDQIERDGTVHVTNQETGSRTTISMADMEIGKSRRVEWAKVEQEPQQRSAAQGVAEEATAAPQAQQGEWQQFDETSGSLQVPRDQMPQIKAEHRGALVNFLNARGVAHQEQTVPASSLKATQAEFSPERVAKAAERTDGDRSILVSSDGHILDGHHQWLAAKENGEDIKVIRLDAPIRELIALGQEFPSSTIDTSSAQQEGSSQTETTPADRPTVSGETVTAPAPAEASQPTAAEYGANNKLVSQDRAAELRQRLKAKFSQLNSGIDPEILAIGTELAVFHIEASARKFSEFAKAMAADLDMPLARLRPYLRSWYNGARDMMEDSNVSIDGMDSPEAVRAELTKLDQDPTPEQPAEAVKSEVQPKQNRSGARPTPGLDAMVAEFDAEIASAAQAKQPPAKAIQPEQTITEGEAREPSTPDNVEQDGAIPENAVGAAVGATQGSGSLRESERAVDAAVAAGRVRPVDGSGVPATSPLDAGTPGDQRVSAEDRSTGPAPGVAGTADSRGNRRGSGAGVQSERQADNRLRAQAQKRSSDLTARQKQQAAADKLPVQLLDADNIKATLPLLSGPQQNDVLKTELRLYRDGGKGMLLTNGTGTGKTYSGLGVAKRVVRNGGDVLIVSPAGVIPAWVKGASDLGMTATPLKNKQDAGGTGVSVTSYQNFSDNQSLIQRNFDLVIYDESHHLMANMGGDSTAASLAHKALTGHPDYENVRGSLALKAEFDAYNADALKAVNALVKAGTDLVKAEQKVFDSAEFKQRYGALTKQAAEIADKLAAEQKEKSTKVVFLSASPFAGHKSVFYTDGYLFESKVGAKDSQSYNTGSPESQYLVSNFGYRMRYNRVTQPGPEVDVGLLERDWADRMFQSGAMTGRKIELDHDYSREFVTVAPGIGEQIDKAFETVNWKEYPNLAQHLIDWRKGGTDRQLTEALRAKASVDRIAQHLKMGRKVVVFHERQQLSLRNPFNFNVASPEETAELAKLRAAAPWIFDIDLSGLTPAPKAIGDRFGARVAYFSGLNKSTRDKDLAEFNKDGGSKDILVIQKDAGKEGLSAHDITGKHQRALMILNTPVSPADAIQMEGRTYRHGLRSDAVIEYPTIQTSFEKTAYRETVSSRTSTAENLAMGSQARNLREAFREGYLDPAIDAPSAKQGRGGRQADSANEGISQFDRAKTYYYRRQKKTSKNKAAEGADYFATPEPLGQKMVEWAKLEVGEKALEPSGGHGAIARWLPESTSNLALEPSPELVGELGIVTNGDVRQMTFEELNTVNKFHAVVMNPPFGQGGSMAIEHIGKAVDHLKDGGRVIAIYPKGPAADAKFEKWFEARRGVYLVASVDLPAITFNRAGTSVATRILVLDKDTRGNNVADGRVQHDLTGITDINELFDRIENMQLPARPDVIVTGRDVNLTEAKITSKQGDEIWRATMTEFTSRGPAKEIGLKEVKKLAEKFGGEVINDKDRFMKATHFDFATEQERERFFAGVLDASETMKDKGALVEPQFNDLTTSTIEVDGKQRPTTNSNGKPIHPTEEGIRNFWRWFGDSKVVDEQGRPLVSYHGTTYGDITEFLPEGGSEDSKRVLDFFRDKQSKNEKIGYMNFRSGSFFSPQPDYAGNYTGENRGLMYPVYIRAENPIYKEGAKVTGIDPSKTPDALILTEDGNINEIAVIDPTQVKSAVGNTGAFDASRSEIYADLATDTAYARLPENNRIQLATRLRKLEQQKDKLTPEQYSERLGELASWLEERSQENAFKRAVAERQRGADMVLERLHRARRRGEISEEAADIAIWALNRNPQLAEDLGFGISSKGGSNYNRAERIAKLMTEGMRDTAPIHEILHHTERMMPPGVQKGIAAAYNKAWDRAYKKATPEQRLALDALRMSAFGNKAARDATMKAFESGLLNYDQHYQLTNASEYWAVNAANIMAARHGASQQGWVARAKEWIRDFIQKARAVFGLPATAAVLKGLDAVTKGDGSFLSNRMLATNPLADTPVRDLNGDYADMPTSPSGLEPDPQIPTEEQDNNRLRRWWDKAKDLVKNGPTDATTDAMQKGLALIPFRPLVQEMARNLPAAGEYLRLKQSMDAMRSRWHAKTDEVAQKWLKYRKDNKDENVELMNLMHESTISQVDPSEDRESTVTNRDREALRFATPGSDKEKELLKKITEDKNLQTEWEKLNSRYEALSPQAKQVFKEVRDAYTSLADGYEKVLLANMEKAINVRIKKAEREHRYELQRIEDEGLAGEDRTEAMDDADHKLRVAKTKTAWNRKARMTQLRQQFELNRLQGPYFPLARFGNLFVTVRDAQTGKVESFSKFEKASEQRAFADLMRKDKNYKVQVGTLDDTGSLRKAVDPNFVADVEDILADLPNAESVKDEVWQRYLESLPDFSVRKSRIHRTGRAGFNADALRAFGNQMFHGSHQLARLAHSFDMEEALDATREEANTSKDSVRDGLVVNEMEKRHEFIMNPTGGPLVQKITQAAFIYALAASPKAAIVNLTQTVIMGIPMLAAYEGGAKGVTRAANQLTRALGDFTQGKGQAQNSKRLTDDERKAMAEAYDTGIIDRTQSHDLAGIGETGVEYSPARTKVMSWLSWGFHHTERLNREVTFLAAYRMARAKGLPHVGAVMKAGDLTWKIHFDYQNTSRPRLMHSDTMKALLVFRNFSINMLYRLFRDIHQAANGDTPEVRREAKIQLAGITGMMMLSAGITGTWGFGIMLMLASAFMDDDKDPEAELKKNMVEALGPMMAGIILDGVPGYATGTSLTDSIGMKDLWFRSPSTQLEGKDEADYWKSQLLGAAPSIADNVVRGYGLLKEGQTYRGIETMMPKAIKDPMKAFRYATEGATNKRGDTIVDEVGAADVIRQALGFVPAKIAEQYDINNAGYNLQQSIIRKRQALMDAWWKAEEAGQEAKLDSLEKDIDAYNDKYPEQEITPKTLRRSAKTREDNAENATGGMRYNRKLRDRILEDQAPTIYR